LFGNGDIYRKTVTVWHRYYCWLSGTGNTFVLGTWDNSDCLSQGKLSASLSQGYLRVSGTRDIYRLLA
jgi:hypothetical protein